jgi:hypothetical protein
MVREVDNTAIPSHYRHQGTNSHHRRQQRSTFSPPARTLPSWRLQSPCDRPVSTSRQPGVGLAREEQGPHMAPDPAQARAALFAGLDSRRAETKSAIHRRGGLFRAGPYTQKAWRCTPILEHDRLPPLHSTGRPSFTATQHPGSYCTPWAFWDRYGKRLEKRYEQANPANCFNGRLPL